LDFRTYRPQVRMNFLSNPIIARLLWVFPGLLLAIFVGLLFAGLEQRQVAAAGEVVEAEIIEVYTRERSEITRGHVELRYVPPGAEAPVQRTIELPLTFLKELEERPAGETVPIMVLPGREQVVLVAHTRTQWVLTLSLAAMALFGAFVFGWMVAGWNRFLARHGDPAGAMA
jgi:hypothetical protein